MEYVLFIIIAILLLIYWNSNGKSKTVDKDVYKEKKYKSETDWVNKSNNKPDSLVKKQNLPTVQKEIFIKDKRKTTPKRKKLTILEQRQALEAKYKNKRIIVKDMIFLDKKTEACPYDGTVLFKGNVLVGDTFYDQVLCCPVCDRAFKEYNEIKSVNLLVPENILWVGKSYSSCKRYLHKVVSVTGILTNIYSDEIKINVFYCYKCNKYYITKAIYDKYKEEYGSIMGNLAFEECKNNFGGNWNTNSKLHLNGYNVSQADGLRPEERKEILRILMINNLLSKEEILNYLSQFISINSRQRNKEIAVMKWKEDLKWISNYKLNSQPLINISNIKKYRR